MAFELIDAVQETLARRHSGAAVVRWQPTLRQPRPRIGWDHTLSLDSMRLQEVQQTAVEFSSAVKIVSRPPDQLPSGRSGCVYIPVNFLTSVPTFARMSLLSLGESVLAFLNLLVQAVSLLTPFAVDRPQPHLSGFP
jgi:hypothetical protein